MLNLAVGTTQSNINILCNNLVKHASSYNSKKKIKKEYIEAEI